MFPTRLSLVTYNLWGNERWPQREPALRLFCERICPDVLCVQELTRSTQQLLDEVLDSHQRVQDSFAGWMDEGNIWWNRELFTLAEYGAEAFGSAEGGDRRLFWVRLEVNDRPERFFVANVHLTAPGATEIGEGHHERANEIKAVIGNLVRLVGSDEPAFLMGDFNDSLIPLSHLFPAGFHSCWAKLSQIPPPTMPAFPERILAMEFSTNFVYDWIVANDRARPLAASSPHMYKHDIAPSDHWPVHAVYELR